jgi:RHS repeat-associated protein
MGAVTSLGYDSGGRLIGYTDPQGNVTQFEFNGLNKITKVTDPQGFFLTYTYDASGNVRERVDANGKRTFYEYNDRGQVTKTTDALNNITQFNYGSGCPSCGPGVDKLTSLIDAKGQTTKFEYNLAGWLVKETSPLGFSKSYTYDPSGNRISRADENGSVTQYSYDNLNELTSIRYSNGDTTTFAYDARGNMPSAANQNIGYTYSFDLNNRITSVFDSTGKTIFYQYDALGNRTQITTPDGRTVIYRYDGANRLTQILSQAGAFAFSHDLSGRRTGLSYPNGVTTAYAYNPSGYLTSLTTRNTQQTIINSFSYAHDAMGNRASMTDILGSHDYTYDDLYQLIQATHPNLPSQQFKYDALGNRLNRVVDADNRLLEDRSYTYRYDSNGNLIERVRKTTGVMTSYSFDDENRLIRIESPEKVVGIKYDPFGRRIEKNVNGRITRYVYDGANMVLEYGPNDRIKSRYIHSLMVDEPLALERGREVYYYHADGLGSVRELTDDTGSIAKSYQYKSFGRIHSQTGTLHQPFTFTGREYDSEIGLYYYRSRYYNPRTGRFLTKDPIGFAGGDVNLYRYTRNNPINWVDPTGMFFFLYHGGISLAAGLAEGRGWESFRFAWDSMWRDWGTQGPTFEDANIHAMVGWDPELERWQRPYEAIMNAMQIVADEKACGRHGNAMHTLQDLQAFWHAGQKWDGNNPFKNWDALGHWFMDVVPSPDALWNAFKISRKYLRQQAIK